AGLERDELHLLGPRGLALGRLRLEPGRLVDADDAALLDVLEAHAAEDGAKRVLPADILQRDPHGALDVAIDDDVPAAELRNRAHDGADVGAVHVDAEGAFARPHQADLPHGAGL